MEPVCTTRSGLASSESKLCLWMDILQRKLLAAARLDPRALRVHCFAEKSWSFPPVTLSLACLTSTLCRFAPLIWRYWGAPRAGSTRNWSHPRMRTISKFLPSIVRPGVLAGTGTVAFYILLPEHQVSQVSWFLGCRHRLPGMQPAETDMSWKHLAVGARLNIGRDDLGSKKKNLNVSFITQWLLPKVSPLMSFIRGQNPDNGNTLSQSPVLMASLSSLLCKTQKYKKCQFPFPLIHLPTPPEKWRLNRK